MRVIDADVLRAELEKIPVTLAKCAYGDIANAIIGQLHQAILASIDGQRTIVADADKTRTLNAVPVVRCGECLHFQRNSPCSRYGYCHAANAGCETSGWKICVQKETRDDYYCADAFSVEDFERADYSVYEAQL